MQLCSLSQKRSVQITSLQVWALRRDKRNKMSEEIVILNGDSDVQSSQTWSQLIGNLRKSILKLKGNFISDDGSFVNYKDMVVSQDFEEYKKLAAELKALDWSYLKDHEDERKAFFINLYNVQMIHALAAQETLPAAPLKVQGMWSRFAYNVGGLLFTLDEIEHGILRCNKGHPNDNKPKFVDEARKALILKNLDPRIHFALNCGAQSCPPIRIYQSDKLDQQVSPFYFVNLSQISHKKFSANQSFMYSCLQFRKLLRFDELFPQKKSHQIKVSCLRF